MNYVLMTILIGFLNVVCFSVIAISHHHILIVHESEGNLETAVMAGSPNLHLPPPVSLRLQRFLIPFALYLNHLLAERIKDGMSVFFSLECRLVCGQCFVFFSLWVQAGCSNTCGSSHVLIWQDKRHMLSFCHNLTHTN